ncbi:sensor domain-containing diguanylate cyclase [Methylorubrum zatmanii]
MLRPHFLRARALGPARNWVALGVFAPVGMLMLLGLMLYDLRQTAWDKAEQTSLNLLQIIEQDIARNVEIIDLSLLAVVDNLKAPGVTELSPKLRQLVLFDRAMTARDLGLMLVLDENGDSIIDANAVPPRQVNNADRTYFQAHKERADLGLVISPPVLSHLLKVPVIVLSRRIDKPDGSFGGVVLASLKLSYFTTLFRRISLGKDSGVNLFLRDGTRLMRHPFVEADIGANISWSQTFRRFLEMRSGRFIAVSARDGVERCYTFTQVGDWPLILNVALGTRDIEADWLEKSWGIALAVVVLCGLTVLFSLLLGQQLRRSTAMQAELTRLSRTDSLTGLPNRRHFEEFFERAWKAAARERKPLALLIVDVDHFKGYNDRFGHAVGDTVLKGIAHSLTASLHRPRDLPARVGGEEFVVLLPGTDRAGALQVAERIHAAVAGFALPSSGIACGTLTVSIGLAIGDGKGATRDLYARADASLYEAKRGGRNQTKCADEADATAEETGAEAQGPRVAEPMFRRAG